MGGSTCNVNDDPNGALFEVQFYKQKPQKGGVGVVALRGRNADGARIPRTVRDCLLFFVPRHPSACVEAPLCRVGTRTGCFYVRGLFSL
jgi:hypothetical protein